MLATPTQAVDSIRYKVSCTAQGALSAFATVCGEKELDMFASALKRTPFVAALALAAVLLIVVPKVYAASLGATNVEPASRRLPASASQVQRSGAPALSG